MGKAQNEIPDYSKYSLTELYDILNRIEKEKYPEKVKAIEEQIGLKKSLEENNYYKLFNKNFVVYRSKFFVWSLLILSFYILLENIADLLLFGRIMSLIYLAIVTTVLVLILSNNKKQTIAIKIYSVILMIPASLKLLALFLLLINYVVNSSNETLTRMNKIIAPGSLLFPIMLITFAFGLYYLLTIKKNVLVRNIDLQNVA
jgi:hypothetical protein